MAFHIKNPETDALARKVAALRKVGITEAVHSALAHELEREQAKPSLVELGGGLLPRPARQRQAGKRQAGRQDVSRQPLRARLMFIGASALTAMLTEEDDARELLARMQQSSVRMTSPPAAWETAIAVARILDLPITEATAAVEEYLALMDIALVAVPPETARMATEAFERYGKGRHPARLNFGDCFAYACARHYGQPLMFKGADFSRTDIEAA